MSQLGSYVRFFVGLALSIEIVRQLILGNQISVITTALGIFFIVLSALFFVFRF